MGLRKKKEKEKIYEVKIERCCFI